MMVCQRELERPARETRERGVVVRMAIVNR